MPCESWLRPLFEETARGMATERVSPGPGHRALSIVTASAPATGVTVGVPICYELLFPDLTRRFVSDGAVLLLAITNDAWYGRTGAPYQFLAMTAVRSAETGVWTARAANTGVSAIIDSQGRVRSHTRIFERDLLVGDLPWRASPLGGTVYARKGDGVADGGWVTRLGVGIAGEGRRGEEGGGVEANQAEGGGGHAGVVEQVDEEKDEPEAVGERLEGLTQAEAEILAGLPMLPRIDGAAPHPGERGLASTDALQERDPRGLVAGKENLASHDADPVEIKTVGVPTGPHSMTLRRVSDRMPAAGST